MISLIIRLALAHIYSASAQKNISLMLKVCFLALTISAFSLTLVVAIMNGFQQETAKKLQGIHADIIIKARGGALDYERLIAVIQKEYPDSIAAATPQAFGNILLKSDIQDTLSPLCACIGIDPSREQQVTTLFDTVINKQDILNQVTDNKLLIGATAAALLKVKSGDAITALYIPEEPQRKKITLQESPAIIGGTFKTGIEEFDTSVVFCNLNFFKTLFKNSDISQIAVKCKPGVDITECARALSQRFPQLEVFTWKDLYPALVSALALEKYAAFIILALCALIAAMNCLALIFMYITQKKMEIVVLKTLGMADSAISSIFMFIGIVITCLATVTGIALAALAGWVIEHYKIIALPDAYYVDHLPVLLDIPLVLVIFCTMLILGTLASYIPSRRIHTFSVAHLLKFGVE